ncbi:MAG: AsmA family protein [Zoogloeaceae bacterium]|nr:AsmA family protein [Zoogloeaceae bacterium]
MSLSLSFLFKRRSWRYWLSGGAAFVLLALLLLMFVRFDGEALKASLIERVRAEKQRELRMDGPLRLKLLPRLSVEMSEVRLLDAAGEADFLTLGRLDGALELLPLIGGKILINRIEIRDWTLHLERDADGRYNFDDLLSDSETDDAPLDVEAEKLVLLNGRVTWRDALEGRQLTLDKVFLRSGRLGLHTQGKLEMGATLRMGMAEDAQAAQIGMTLDTLYRLDDAALRLRLDNPRVNLKGHGGALEQARLVLTARQIQADLSAPSFDLSQLRAQGERVAPEAADDRLTGEIELEALRWQHAAPLLRGLKAHLALADDTLKASLNLEALQGENGRMESPDIALDWAGNWRQHRYQGKLVAPLRVEDDARGLHVRVDALQGEMRVDPGPMLAEALNLRLSGAFSLDAGGATAEGAAIAEESGQGAGNLRFDLDDSQLALRWQWKQGLPGRPPRLEFQAHLDQLNLDRYLRAEAALETASQEPAARAATGDAMNKTEAAVAAAKEDSLEISGQARIDELRYKGAQMRHLESRVCFSHGELSIRQTETGGGPKNAKRAKNVGARLNPC